MKKAYLIIKNENESKKVRFIKVLKTLLKDRFISKGINELETSLILSNENDLATINASFLAIKEDIDSKIKILILPSLNEKLFKYVNYLEEGEIKNLFELVDKRRDLYNEMFFIIEDFDEENLRTIKCYIEENKSPLLSSLRLYCHRNTVSYRVKVFEKKTKINLDTFYNYIFIYYLIKYRLEEIENDERY